MDHRTDSRPGARGLTVKQLMFIFIGGVGVCAIFFTLGFLVGTNERNLSAAGPVEERVAPPGEIPPPINGPLNSSSASPATSAADSSTQVEEQNIAPSGAASNPSMGAVNPAPLSSPPTSVREGKSSSAVTQPLNRAGAPYRGSGPTIQIAALHSEKDAESLVATLRSQGYPVFLVTPAQAGTNDGIYRVQVGPYPTRPAAINAKDKLEKEGFSPFIK